MKVTVEYFASVHTTLRPDFLRKIAQYTCESSTRDFLSGKTISIHAIAVSERKIRELNKKHRQKDSVTDILSFFEYSDEKALRRIRERDIFLGELFFSPRFIRRAAREDEVSFERELAYVFSHGVLHLLGFDHEPKMFQIQERVTDVFTGKKNVKNETYDS